MYRGARAAVIASREKHVLIAELLPEKKEVHKMKNIETLMKKATELKSEGLVEGQISEELNVSSETVTWLLTHAETSEHPGAQGYLRELVYDRQVRL